MDYNLGDYTSRLQIKQYPARDLRETAEGKYWKQFKAPILSKQVGFLQH
jgi:U3 small nucleolar RNA-associated protein 15